MITLRGGSSGAKQPDLPTYLPTYLPNYLDASVASRQWNLRSLLWWARDSAHRHRGHGWLGCVLSLHVSVWLSARLPACLPVYPSPSSAPQPSPSQLAPQCSSMAHQGEAYAGIAECQHGLGDIEGAILSLQTYLEIIKVA